MTRLLTFISIISISIPFSVYADIENGKQLHDSNCISCHTSRFGGDGTGIYTREDNRIESHTALVKQVRRCRDSLGIAWPAPHVEDVVEYLNTSFYKFKK